MPRPRQQWRGLCWGYTENVFRSFPFLLATVCFAASPSAADLARQIQDAGLDPSECYRVRDLNFQQDDIKLYLTDGYLIFSKPVQGVVRSAIFTADVEGGDAELLLLPPTRGERQSLAMFTNSANLDEHFRAALMVFTDGAAGAKLKQKIQEGGGKKAPEIEPVLAEKWGSVLANVQSGFQIRMLEDMLAPPAYDSGVFFLALDGKQLGTFDMMYDPRSREQIVAGQLSERAGRVGYNVWTSFPSRSARQGKLPPPPEWFSVAKFQIDATLGDDLGMKASTKVSVRIGQAPLRVFPFDISSAVNVTSVTIDGAPAELFRQESLRGRALRGSDNDVFLVVAPEPLAANSDHEFQFQHEGAVIATAGSGVYFVGARASWYPRAESNFALYDLTFHYPKRLTLVAAGDLVSDRSDADSRTTHWRTPVPIRMAGFNLGDYEKVSGTAPGFTVEVYGNKHLQTSLTPKPPPAPALDPPRVPRLRIDTAPSVQPGPLPPPDPLARLRAVAADVSSALEYFNANFGPPALKTLTVAPIPGAFGQGFPGLVYLSTLSYLDPNARPAALRDTLHQLFFSELIEAHEVAHQWWGNVMTSASYQDEWMPEALSSYSALMWLEKKKGTKAMESVLDEYREHLLTKDEQGRTLESAGPIVWGTRLDAANIRDGWRSITYEKGAWIFHMLRRRMGDERFFKMLAELRRRYEYKSVSTQDLKSLAKEFSPPKTDPQMIDDFFDNWVDATGIPALKLKFTSRGVAPAMKISGSIAMSGVDDDFSADVPVEIQFAKGPAQRLWVHCSGDGGSFSATLRQAPARVVIPDSILARR
jgi:hypothetical protein